MKKLLIILLCLPLLFSTCKKEDEESSALSIGDIHQGGIVFYLDGNGGGLVSASTDQSTGAEWGCFMVLISGANGTAIGTGAQNTTDIINTICTPNTPGKFIAANICANLTLGGYSDWFLPSRNELNEMYLNIGQGNALGVGNIGGFTNGDYWSSTQHSNYSAWGQSFINGSQINVGKFIYSTNLRAIRAF
tara:strand:+ start:39 stop:611 length:573 start_codon:yes stop_codon:yes gene_type:complete